MREMRTRFSDFSYTPTCCGCRKYKVKKAIVIDHGYKSLVDVEERDLQDEINSFLSDTLIGNVLARVALGDTSGLRPLTKDSYCDVTKYQRMTLADMSAAASRVGQIYDSLPSELKARFGSSEALVNASNVDVMRSILSLFDVHSTKKEENVNG